MLSYMQVRTRMSRSATRASDVDIEPWYEMDREGYALSDSYPFMVIFFGCQSSGKTRALNPYLRPDLRNHPLFKNRNILLSPVCTCRQGPAIRAGARPGGGGRRTRFAPKRSGG